ncbi:SDR family NAD(P)-dependent oxidoreductase [Streptomyces sp. NPDC088387]|uniref:SDR family NAD(P)-dependent oxidoreductase n=1 Tax=Streptomyces sp. NPDC088387 TaxID=3365859 RepID=UPI003818C94E
MESLRFDGRVAIVTGAGRGLGRAHALLLGARGARVVVNDLGGSPTGEGQDPGPAERVAAEIRAAGGEAVADGSDIATTEGAEHVVATAIGTYGRLDVVVNNAGIVVPDAFPDVTLAELRRHFTVHVGGSFNVTRASWPHLVAAGYGRVVLTGSHAVLGADSLIAYGTAKGGVHALVGALAQAGRKLGITVNGVAPVAATRIAGGNDDGTSGEGVLDGADPALVSPVVALLSHESCAVTGETVVSGGRRQARLFTAETTGYVHPDTAVTPEVLAEHWEAIRETAGHHVLTDTTSWMELYAAWIAAGTPA